MHGTRPLTRLVLALALGLSGAAGAESESEAAAGPVAKPGATQSAAAVAAQASPKDPAEPDQEQIDVWLAAARALKAERPALFGEAEGVLATEVLADSQGAAAGIEPGDVLLAYGDTTLGSAGQLVELTGATPPEQTLNLRWLRRGPGGEAGVHRAAIRGGRIGVAVRDLAETPVARMGALGEAGWAARNRGRYGEAMGLFRQGLALAEGAGDDHLRGQFLRLIGEVFSDTARYPDAIDHHEQALAIARETANRWAEGAAHNSLGIVYQSLGRYPEALEHHIQALTIHREIGDRAGEGKVVGNLGIVYKSLGRYPEALKHHTQALAIHREIGDRAGEGKDFGNLGAVYQKLGRYPEALEHFAQVLRLHREIGDRQGEGKDLSNLGNVYYSLDRYSEALEHYSQALAIAREIGDRAREGEVLGALGGVCHSLGRYPEALEHHSRALAIAREIGNRAGEGKGLDALGDVYHSLGRYPEALEHHSQALAIACEIGGRAGEGARLSALGNDYHSLGRYREALEHHSQALAIAREIGDRAGEGARLGALGSDYASLGRYSEALEHHSQALAIAREIGNRAGEGRGLGDLGDVYYSLSRYPEAIQHLTDALVIARDISDRQGEGGTLGILGNVYCSLGRYPEAIEHSTKALAIAREIGDRPGKGWALGILGNVYQSLGRYPEAIEHYTQALGLCREIGDRAGEGATLTNLGLVSARLGRFPEALDNYTQALRVVREIGARAGESTDLLNLGVLHAAQGHTPEALAYYQEALALQAELAEPDSLWRLWNNLRPLYSTDQPAPAILVGKRAVNQIQSMRATNASLAREQQQSFLTDKEFVYRGLADLLIAQGRHAEAQQVLDMLKEQELYDYIKEEGAHDPRQTRVGVNAMERDWSQAYDAAAAPAPALAQKLGELTRINPEVRTESEQAEIARLTAERDALSAKLQRQLAALPERFAAIDPARQAAEDRRFAEAPDTKRALLAALSQRSRTRTGLLQFVLLKDKVRVLLTTPDGWHTAVAQVPKGTLATEIETLRASLTDPTQDAKTPAEALYRRLVAPLAEAIDAAKLESLLVHLDGRLRYIPFAALHDGKQWLAERWPIVYYTAASERKDELRGGAWQVAGLGVSEARPGFDPLPTVAGEIDGIVREGDGDARGVLPGHAALNADFSEGALRQQAGNSANRILHIASHFLLRPGNDAQSSLLLGTLAADGKPDTLSLKALRETEPRLDLRHLDLVTLSACETAMGGADDTGAEIEGMGAVIQRQGARGVLASLWPVEDASTGPLMQTFYRLRAERPALTKAQALRLAQLDLLRGTLDGAPPPQGCATAPSGGRPGPDPGQDPSENRGERSPLDLGSKGEPRPALAPACRWSHPYYWAPFILMGNWL